MSDWPHAPPHRILERGTYMLTGSTYKKVKLFNTPEKLDLLSNIIFNTAEEDKILIEAWAVMSNHYHLILYIAEESESIKKFISKVHGLSAIKINKADKISGRKVWHNYWDSGISYQKSYYARLNYVNKNPQHHGIVEKAEEYHWCSEGWYKHHLDQAFSKTVNSFKFDNVNVFDDF